MISQLERFNNKFSNKITYIYGLKHNSYDLIFVIIN